MIEGFSRIRSLSNRALFRIAQEMEEGGYIEMTLNLGIGRNLILDMAVIHASNMGESYDAEAISEEVLGLVTADLHILEATLEEDWADIVNIEIDASNDLWGYIELEDEVEELTPTEVDDIELVVDEFVRSYVEDVLTQVEPEDLIWIPVESSNVEAFAYDEAERFLYVRFLAKGNYPSTLYVYYGVEPEIYNQFIMAPSKGKFVWQALRDRYEYERLE